MDTYTTLNDSRNTLILQQEVINFMINSLVRVVRLTALYWYGLWCFIRGDSYEKTSIFGEDVWAKVQVYSLSLIFWMWYSPHYRSRTFQQDMIDNLRNVAIPGTGVPISEFCYNYYVCLLFVVLGNPLVCLCGAINKCRKGPSAGFGDSLSAYYEQHLLHPDDWFSFWRLNCRLTSAQSLITQSSGFAFENKWKFLLDGYQAGVPVSPFLEVEELVCKHMNVEGGTE